jgi:hypothetical protein
MLILVIISVVVVLAPPVFLLMCKYPYLAALAVVFTVPLIPITSVGSISLAYLVGGAGGLAWLVHALYTGKWLTTPPYFVGMLSYCGVAALSLIQNPGPDATRLLVMYGSFLALELLLHNEIDSIARLRGALYTLCGGFDVFVVISLGIFLVRPSIYAQLHPQSSHGRNVRMITGLTDIGNSANLTAKCLSCLLPLQFSLFAEGGGRAK